MALPRAERLAEKYYCERLSAGESVDFTKALGRPANLLSILAEENATIVLNKTGSEIVMKRDEAIVMINVMEVENLDVISGSVRVFATNVPRWMPALFWTRSVTVLGVADAVKDALADYGAAKDDTLKSVLPRYLVDSAGNELTNYIKSMWKPDNKIYDETIASGEIWNISGNMVKSVKNLTVQGTLIVSDQALLRTWGNVLVDGGKVIVQDSAQVISEVAS